MSMKTILFDHALRMGFAVSRKSPDASVLRTLQRLQPVTTNIPLIRLGGAGDGGYLVPNDLDEIAACFSPGVDTTASFEEAVLARGIPCYLADASVTSPPIQHPQIDFERKFLGVVNDDTYSTLDSWVDLKLPGNRQDLLLQMDIEGHEWPVLLNTSDRVLQSFRIIVLELHGLPHSFNPAALQMFEAVLERLSRAFHVVHAHPNGHFPGFRYQSMKIPHFLEVTLLRKDRAEATGFAQQFPHPLDATNVPGQPDERLPDIFIGAGR